MGFSRFSGPVYGAKSLLWSVSRNSTDVSTSAITMAGIVVPPGQDWFVTDLHAHRMSTHSTDTVITLVDDSTTVADLALTSSLANLSGSTQPTADGGEVEGTKIASGSSVTLTIHNAGSSVMSTGVSVWTYGYIRFVDSSRVAF